MPPPCPISAVSAASLPVADRSSVVPLLRIPLGSLHYTYAQLVVNGYRHREACEQLGLNPRTVHRWRSNLMAAGRVYFQRTVTYEACAREALQSQRSNAELRAAVDSL